MAGSDSSEIQDGFIREVTVGTTPASPAFTKSSFDLITMTGNPRISEAYSRAARGERSGIGRNGVAIAGSASGKLIYGEYDDFLASLFQDDWSSNVLVNGKSQIAMSIEQSIPQGAGGTVAYTRYRGVEAVSGQISLQAGQDANVSFDLLGVGRDAATATAISGATYGNPSVTEIIGSGADVGTITMSGLTLDCMESLNIDWGVVNKAEQPRISSDDPCGVSRGTMRPILTGRFYVETNFISLFNEATNGSDFALVVPVGQTTGEKYSFNFPSCEFVQSPLVPQENGDAFLDYQILPKYDSGIGGTCEVTRAIA